MAATDYFLKLDGIDGESKDEKHEKEIDVESFSWGATQRGELGQRKSGKVAMADFHFTMAASKASPQLMQYCAFGKPIPKAVLTIRKAGQKQQEYMKVTLSDVMISSYQTDGQAGANTIPKEQISLNFGKIEILYQEQLESGQLGGAVFSIVDLRTVSGG